MADRPRKGSRITPDEIKEMAILYDQLGTYAAVARKMGRSADSVSKYIKKLKSHDNMAIELAKLIRETK
jgi:DNA invertase Pin-like site-specific DNA recombinase